MDREPEGLRATEPVAYHFSLVMGSGLSESRAEERRRKKAEAARRRRQAESEEARKARLAADAAAKRRKRSAESDEVRQQRKAKGAEARRKRFERNPALRDAAARAQRQRRAASASLREAEAEAKRRKRRRAAGRQRIGATANTVKGDFRDVCSVCDRLWHKKDLAPLPEGKRNVLESAFPDQDLSSFKVCRTCMQSVETDKVLNRSTSNEDTHLPALDTVRNETVEPVAKPCPRGEKQVTDEMSMRCETVEPVVKSYPSGEEPVTNEIGRGGETVEPVAKAYPCGEKQVTNELDIRGETVEPVAKSCPRGEKQVMDEMERGGKTIEPVARSHSCGEEQVVDKMVKAGETIRAVVKLYPCGWKLGYSIPTPWMKSSSPISVGRFSYMRSIGTQKYPTTSTRGTQTFQTYPSRYDSDDRGVVSSKHALCDTAFSCEESLEKHHRAKHLHKGGKHQCRFCDYCSNHLSHVKEHERRHTGEKPYVCRVCAKSYRRNDNLKKHLRTVHEEP
ncbi:zinc finger protein 709-like [Ornithodoros turicata]|uniref:zinc finger protein 709-like n=1 Tax=Ornithodoros turicata TaxID=34597 RepID=UPI0031397D62